MIGIERQKGVALLFALGILSLILVMGLAFLGNSLISQKIAFNSQEASSAKLAARNAVDRALAHLTLFNLMQARDQATYYASDASSVFSRLNSDPLTLNGTSQTAGSDAAAISQDMLASVTSYDSKMTVEKKYDTPWYDGASSAAKWIYVHRNGVESNGATTTNTNNPIIARYAYQVLPQTSQSRLSLFGVTSGVTGIAGITPAASNPRIPHTHRWGIDIDELVIPGLNNMFMTYWGTGANYALTPQYEFDNFTNLLAGSSSPNPFQGNSRDIENRKRWLRNIFVEGKGRVAREMYKAGFDWYPRFNLSGRTGGTDVWYSRFLRNGEADSVLNSLKNSATVLDRLTIAPANNAVHKFDDSKVRDSDYVNQSGHTGIGLPFLRSIGDDTQKGAFSNVEYLRKQIAANLNDYCDADYIPTSDVESSKWNEAATVTGTQTPPNYTGNEQTPYINEVGFGFKIGNAKFTANGGEYKFSADVESEVLVELINIYKSFAKKKDGTSLTAQDLSFYGVLKELSIGLDVSLKADVTFFENKDGVETKIGETKAISVPYSESVEAHKLIESATLKVESGANGFTGDGPYWVKNIPLASGGTSTKTIEIDLTNRVKEAFGNAELNGKTVSKVTVALSEVAVKLESVKFNFGNFALTAPGWEAGSSAVGIDFVCVENIAGSVRSVKPAVELFNGSETDFNTKLGGTTNALIVYSGGMEARDPRQNLNAKFNPSTAVANCTNDWVNVKEPSFEISSGPVQTLSESLKWDDVSTRISSGKINSVSNPADPKADSADDASKLSNIDVETATDPAWKGNTAGQHISTAVIRNAPMRSPWELGFIHRGVPFQTINLKKAGGIDGGATLDDFAHEAGNFENWTESRGTKYENGDAGILDQIKMTEFNKSYGKVDMSSLRVANAPAWWVSASEGGSVVPITDLNRNVFKSLFENMRSQTPAQFLEESENLETVPAAPAPPAVSAWLGTALSPNPVGDDFNMENIPAGVLRSKVFNKEEMKNIFVSGSNDAAQEERIGKTVNLLEGESYSVPNVFKIVVVAQTIRDLTGDIGRVNNSGDVVLASTADGLGKEALLGRFDARIGANPDASIYYDEILSECRMLVTVEKIHYMEGNAPRARLRVKQIEYLD